MPRIPWEQERPYWCNHPDCNFLRRVMDNACIGKFKVPKKYEVRNGENSKNEVVENTHGWCINGVVENSTIHLETNINDIEYLRWLFDVIDKKETGWI